MKLGALGEDLLLEQIVRDLPGADNRKNFAGAGDDCAIVQIADAQNLLVLKTDCVVEGVHFVRKAKASHVGWKAMMRPLSDFAAASAVPRFALITLIAPQKTEVAWVTRTLSRTAKVGGPFRRQNSWWRNEQHTRADCYFRQRNRVCRTQSERYRGAAENPVMTSSLPAALEAQ